MLNFKAVIFDMDGVIFDSESVYYRAFFAASDALEVEITDDFNRVFSGKTATVCFSIIQDFFAGDEQKTRQFFASWLEERDKILAENGLDFREGFLTLFDAVKKSGRQTGVVTSGYYADLKDNFEKNTAALISDFDHIITVEDVKYPKPHPQPYQMMMQHLRQDPAHCVVIEDSVIGATAALDAGANTIMINAEVTPPADISKRLCFHASHHDEILHFLQNHGL